MESESVTPAEIRGIFFVIADIGKNVSLIRMLLEEDDGEAPEDDA